MATRNYLCPVRRKKLKFTHGLTRHINIYMSYQVSPICMQLKQNTPIPGKDENV